MMNYDNYNSALEWNLQEGFISLQIIKIDCGATCVVVAVHQSRHAHSIL